MTTEYEHEEFEQTMDPEEVNVSVGKCGRDLLVDKNRQYTEDEKRVAIMVQTKWRALCMRRDYQKLINQGLSMEAVDFQRALKTSSRVHTNVAAAPADVEASMQAPVGAVLAMIAFHHAYKDKAASNFWALWKCFIRNAIIDLPLGIAAHFFLLTFAGAAFYAPMWVSVTVRFIFYDGDGQVEIDKFVKWLMVFSLCTTALWCLASIFFVLLQERFGNRVKHHITIISAEFGKLISKTEVDRFRGEDLMSAKRIFFMYAPKGLACFLMTIAGLNFLFIRSQLLGGLTLATIVISGIFLALHDQFVRAHALALEESLATESEFWTYLQSRDKEIALSEIMALSDATAKFSVKESFFHITLGGTYRMMLMMSGVVIVFLGSKEIALNNLRQYELLFCVFYYLFTMACVFWLNSSTVGILKDLGNAFRLAHFLNGTSRCVSESAGIPPLEPGTERLGVQRLQAKTARPPFGVILISTLLFGGSIASFAVLAATGNASITCKPAEMTCHICGEMSHKMEAAQYFDMDSGCTFVNTPEELTQMCIATSSNSQKRRMADTTTTSNGCDVQVMFTSGQGDDTGYHVTNGRPDVEEDLCGDMVCGKKDDCHMLGQCNNNDGKCMWEKVADNSTCRDAEGTQGSCQSGVCTQKSLSGMRNRRLADTQTANKWHADRRVQQIAHVSRETLDLSAHERMYLQQNQIKKMQIVEDMAEASHQERVHGRRMAKGSVKLEHAPEHTTCPLPGHSPDEECPASKIYGCMDTTALNYNMHADTESPCCHAPNRYVKIDFSQSVFKENFWTLHVAGKLAGMGEDKVIGDDEVCVPADVCVKATVYDESCDGFSVGGGSAHVYSRMFNGEDIATVVDSSGDFECSKKVRFGTCPVEGCTDAKAVNFDVEAGHDDGTCEYVYCDDSEKAIIVKIQMDAKPEETDWKITDDLGYTLVDSGEFKHFYSGSKSINFYCVKAEQCVYFLIKDSAGDGLDANGYYEVLYGSPGQFEVVASGGEFEHIRAHFVGGADTCKH